MSASSNVISFNSLQVTALEDKELLAIIKTDHYAKLDDNYKPYLCSPAQLFEYPHYDRALEWAIKNSTLPLEGFFYVTFCVTLVEDIALALITGVFGITIVYGLYNYWSRRKLCEAKKQDDMHYFQLAQLRLSAADTYIARLKNEMDPPLPEVMESGIQTQASCNKVKASMLKGFGSSVTLLVGYYLSAVWLLQAIELAAIASTMLTPIGWGIAIALSVFAGLYCGYRHYKTLAATELVTHKKNVLAKEIQMKRDECVRLSGFRQGLFYSGNPVSEEVGRAHTPPTSSRGLSAGSRMLP